MKVCLSNALYYAPISREHIGFRVSPLERDEVEQMVKAEEEKGRYKFKVTIEPFRPERTTGPRSQNHHIWGHRRQIAVATGNSMYAVKEGSLHRAVEMGYPVEKGMRGQEIPKDETLATTVEASIIIEALHVIAAELGIVLEEG